MLVQFLHCQVSQSYIFMLVTNMKGLVSSKGKYCQSDSHYKDFVFPSLNTHSTFNKAEVKHFTARGLDNNIPTFVSKKKKRKILSYNNKQLFLSVVDSYPNNTLHQDKKCMCIHTFKQKHVCTHSYSHTQIYANICTKSQI